MSRFFMPFFLPFFLRRARIILGALVLLVPLAATPASGADGDLAQFNEASAEAYRHYRSAVHYLHTGNPGLAALELSAMTEKWRALEERFAKNPPAAYAGDPAWGATLTDVGDRIEAARAFADAGAGEDASRTLAPLRAELAELRRRNGVVVFSDQVDAVTAAMETLWVHRHEPPDLADAELSAEITEEAARMRAALERCREEASGETAANPQFARLVEGSLVGLDRIDRAVSEQDQRLLINTLRELRSFERLLWLEFG